MHNYTVMPAKSDSYVIFCLQLLSIYSVVSSKDFLGTQVSLPEFQGDIYKFWGKHQIFQFFTCKLKSYPGISVHFLFKF